LNKKKKIKKYKILAIICWILGLIYIGINIFSYKASIDYYIEYGYTLQEVLKDTWANTLLPAVIEPLIISGGIGVILMGIYELLSIKNNNEETETLLK